MNIALAAMEFARDVHKRQRRKYTDNPYQDHLAEVAGIVATVVHELPIGHIKDGGQIVIATAWLHDSAEDQGVLFSELADRFGLYVADGVMALSDLEAGNRATRKAASRLRLSRALPWIQSVKVADCISNTASIVANDPQFGPLYAREVGQLLDVLTGAHPELLRIARAQLAATPSPKRRGEPQPD